MSEYGRERPDVDLVVWAEGVGHETVTPMDPAKVLVGYAFGDPIAADEYNSHMQRLGALLHWLEGCAIREFSSLAAACASDIEVGRRFTVRRALSGGGGDIVYNAPGLEAPTYPVLLCTTDGRLVYYVNGTSVYAEDPDNPGVQVWSYLLTGVTVVNAIAVDGGAVFLACTSSTGTEVKALNAETGANLAGWSTGVSVAGNAQGVASNGEFVAVIDSSNLVNIYERASYATGADFYNHAATLDCVCVDGLNAYIGGLAGVGGAHIEAVSLSITSATLMWSVVLVVTAGTPRVVDICTDGERVFAIGAVITDGAAQYNMWCFSNRGVLLWRRLTDGSFTGLHVACDDRYVYASDQDGCDAYDKTTGALLGYMQNIDPNLPFTSDGLLLWGPAGDDYIAVEVGGLPSRGFVRVSDTDPDSRPFYKCAVPE